MLLSRYFLARFLVSFVAIVSVLVLGIGVVESMGNLEELLSVGKSPLGAARYLVLRIASIYLPQIVPAACAIAAFVALGVPARGLEIVALKAGGIPPWRIYVPVLVAAAVIAAGALFFNETVGVAAQQAARRMVQGDGAQLSFRSGSFWYHKGRYVYNVRRADASARLLEDVAVFELDENGRLLRTIRAKQARIGEGGRWTLTDALLRSFDPTDPTKPEEYARVDETELILTEEWVLLQAGVTALSAAELAEYRDGQPANDPERVRADALIHRRLTAPLSSLVFALLGVPLGLRVETTRSMARPALQGTLLLVSFLLAREYASRLAIQGVTSPVFTAWALLGVFAALGLWQLARSPR